MNANRLLKANIDALLRARHQTRHDLAQWCRRSDPWLSKILSDSPTEQARGLPLKYLDRIADFFGIATYQLFQPGISALHERRKAQRRSGKDRRVSALSHQVRESVSSVVANLTSADVADLLRLKALGAKSRDLLRDEAQRLERSEHQTGPRGRKRRVAEKDAGEETAP